MNSQQLLKQIKFELKSRGLVYRDLAKELSVSEVTIKRSFVAHDISLERILQICSFLGLDLTSLIKRAEDSTSKQIYILSDREDQYFYQHRDEYAFLILLCYHGTAAKMQRLYGLKRATLVRYLSRLAKLGFVELLLDDKIRFLKGISIGSRPGAKLGEATGRKTRMSFVDASFSGQDALMDMSILELSPRSATELRKAALKVSHLATQLHVNDEKLESSRKIRLGLMVAARPWDWDQVTELENLIRNT